MDANRASGVNGVPFIIIDGKWALNGVQSTECYLQVSKEFWLLHVFLMTVVCAVSILVLVDLAENFSSTVNTQRDLHDGRHTYHIGAIITDSWLISFTHPRPIPCFITCPLHLSMSMP